MPQLNFLFFLTQIFFLVILSLIYHSILNFFIVTKLVTLFKTQKRFVSYLNNPIYTCISRLPVFIKLKK